MIPAVAPLDLRPALLQIETLAIGPGHGVAVPKRITHSAPLVLEVGQLPTEAPQLSLPRRQE